MEKISVGTNTQQIKVKKHICNKIKCKLEYYSWMHISLPTRNWGQQADV